MTHADPHAFREHRLSSGLRILYQHRPMHFSACRVLVHAGSRQDPPHKRELMHLLEHLVGADIPGIPSSTMSELVRWYKGKRFSMELGETTLDWSAYNGWARNVLVEDLLRFMHVMTMQPSLNSQLEKERDIIRQERALRSNYYDHALDYARARFMFGKDPAGNQEAWGTDPHLDRITIDDVREAHARWYHPANTSLIVVGGIDEDALLKSAEDVFCAADRPFSAPEPVTAKSFERTQTRARRLSGNETPDVVELRYYWYLPPANGTAVAVAVGALGDALSEMLREKLQALYEADVETENAYRDFRKLELKIYVPAEKERRVRSAIREVLLRTPEELDFERFRAESMLDHEYSEPDTSKTLSRAAQDIEVHNRPIPMAESTSRLEALTADDVRAVLTTSVTPEKTYLEIIEM